MSKLRTDLTPDDPVVLDASYQQGSKTDRRKIDDQIIDLQHALVKTTLKNGVRSNYRLSPNASGPITPGTAFCVSQDIPLGSTVIPATTAALAAAGGILGVALERAPAGSYFNGAIYGIIDPAVFNLGVSLDTFVPSPIGVDGTTGLLKRVSQTGTDSIVGSCTVAGTCTITATEPATVRHGDMQPSEGIHGAVAGSYDTAAHRQTAPVIAGDVNKFVTQTDTDPPTLWWLYKVTSGVGSYRQVTTASESTFSGDFGAIFEAIAGAGTTLAFYGADRGLHKTGSIVNSIDNQITTGTPWGNLVEYSSGVGIGTAGAGVNGHADVIANGTTQQGKITTAPQPLVAPATTNIHVWALMMGTSASPGANAMFCGVGFNLCVVQLPGGVVFEQYNGSALATALVANSYGRLRASFTGSSAAPGSTGDEIKWGATAAVGSVNSGNAIGGNAPYGIFGDGSGGTFFPGKMLAAVVSKASKANFLAAAAAAEAQLAGWYGSGAVLI